MTNKKSYSDKLKDPRWQRKRLEILERDNFTCLYCGDDETTLHVHHLKYKGEPWEVNSKYLETVCKHCHAVLTELKDIRVNKIVKRKEHENAFIYYAYAPFDIFLLYEFIGSEIQLITRISYSSFYDILENIPK